jgi:hypothetical protein
MGLHIYIINTMSYDKSKNCWRILRRRGIFCSTDLGISLNMLNDGFEWPKEYLSQHFRL